MAKFVLAGKADCPFYALAEYLGDQLKFNLPNFQFHKIVKTSSEWPDWLKGICEKNQWNHTRSPIIWRELVDRGGKGSLIGGANEFQEYAFGYYGVTINIKSADALIIAKENEKMKEIVDEEEKQIVAKYDPLYICVTNASSPICFALISYLLSGEIIKQHPDIVLNLFDAEPSNLTVLEGVADDIMNMAFATPKERVRITSDKEAAFKKCKIVIFLDAILENSFDTKDDWLRRIHKVFSDYGQTLNQVADQNVKVLVGGQGNINLQTCVLIENAPNIQKKNFVGVTRVLEYHAKSVLAHALKVNTAFIGNLAIWGNPYDNYLIDIQKSIVYECDCAIIGPPFFHLSSVDMVFKEKWLKTNYEPLVHSRKITVEKELKHPEYNLYARAVALTLDEYWNGSTTNDFFSLSIMSEGWYDVPKGIVFTFPVRMSTTGNYNVVEDFEITAEFEKQIQAIVKALINEKRVASGEVTYEEIQRQAEAEAEAEAEARAKAEAEAMAPEEAATETLPGSENMLEGDTITDEMTLDTVEKTGGDESVGNPEEEEEGSEEEEEEEEATEEVEEETATSTVEATITSTAENETVTNPENSSKSNDPSD